MSYFLVYVVYLMRERLHVAWLGLRVDVIKTVRGVR